MVTVCKVLQFSVKITDAILTLGYTNLLTLAGCRMFINMKETVDVDVYVSETSGGLGRYGNGDTRGNAFNMTTMAEINFAPNPSSTSMTDKTIMGPDLEAKRMDMRV